MKQLTPISVHNSTATRHGKMWTAFMRLTPHPTSHNHDPSVLSKDAAARRRFDTYLAQTTRTRRRPITFRPPGRTSPDLWVQHQTKPVMPCSHWLPKREIRRVLTLVASMHARSLLGICTRSNCFAAQRREITIPDVLWQSLRGYTYVRVCTSAGPPYSKVDGSIVSIRIPITAT